MREMTPEMAALLKSKTMVGDNRPTHKITLGNYNSGYEWEDIKYIRATTTKPIPEQFQDWYDGNWGGGSFVTRADGKVLVTYCNSANDSIYLSIVDSEEDVFFDNNKASANEVAFKTVTNVLASPSAMAQSRLQKFDDGSILLYIFDVGDSSNIPSKLEVYKSSNGLGDDFVLLAKIQEHQRLANTLDVSSIGIGQPIQIETGRILIPYVGYGYYAEGYSRSKAYVAYSDDDGFNWINKTIYDSDWLQQFTCRGIGKFGSQLVVAVGKYYSTGSMWFYTSNDNGENWNKLVQYPGNAIYDGLFWGNDGYSYWLNSDDGTTYKLYRHSDKEALPTTVDAYGRGLGTAWGEAEEFIDNGDLKEVLWGTEAGRLAFAGTSYYGGRSVSKINGGIRQELKLQAKKIDIQRQKGMAGGLTIDFDNKQGILAPDGETNQHLLWPNTEIIVEQGYGNELLQTFKGYIDSISMQANGQQANISVSARDSLKRALDQTITTSMGNHVITALDTKVENLWRDLATMAGLQIGVVEETGITITEKVFSWETYGDAFSWLSELVGFEVICDEQGIVHFRKQQIPTTPEIAYEFVEGVDIISLGYTINDNDLYRWIIVHGKRTTIDGEGKENEEVIEFKKEFSAADYWGLLPQKILKIDAPEADTLEKCEQIALKAEYLMISRARIVKFQSIGIPHLQIGDFIRVTESSTTISEVYRITDLSTSQDADTYTMDITCHWFSAPVEEVIEE